MKMLWELEAGSYFQSSVFSRQSSVSNICLVRNKDALRAGSYNQSAVYSWHYAVFKSQNTINILSPEGAVCRKGVQPFSTNSGGSSKKTCKCQYNPPIFVSEYSLIF